MDIQNNEYDIENENEKKYEKTMKNLFIGAFSVFIILVILIFIWAGLRDKINNKSSKKYSEQNQTQKVQNTQAQNSKNLVILPKKPLFDLNEPFNFVITRRFQIKGIPEKVYLTIELPSNTKFKQTISRFSVSPIPDKISDDGKKANYMIKNPPRDFMVVFRGTADTQTYTIERAKKLNRNIDGKLSDEDFIRYTRPENGIESKDILIKRMAKKIRNGSNREETVKNIYDYVVNHLQYDKSVINSDRGAFYAASNGRGTCTEYSALFVALCRAKKIPARVVKGFYLPFEDNVMPEYPRHAWAEVYFDEYGWVNFDPTISYDEQIVEHIKENKLSHYDISNTATANRRYIDTGNTDIYMQFETKNPYPVSITNLGDKVSFSKAR